MTDIPESAIHECEAGQSIDTTDFDFMYGDAFSTIALDAGESVWGADNGEYRTPIVFCPWCGVRLPLPEKEAR
jgi:hypothetical protein